MLGICTPTNITIWSWAVKEQKNHAEQTIITPSYNKLGEVQWKFYNATNSYQFSHPYEFHYHKQIDSYFSFLSFFLIIKGIHILKKKNKHELIVNIHDNYMMHHPKTYT